MRISICMAQIGRIWIKVRLRIMSAEAATTQIRMVAQHAANAVSTKTSQ
nr:MAG TPA: hypothetical protein [Caudoviricetes sp.]